MSEKNLTSAKIKLGLSLAWFLFTFSLVVWWWTFAFQQLEMLSDVLVGPRYNSIRRMLIWEGAVLVVAVFVGGLVLVLLTNRERRRNEQLRNFFSNYSHDLKTSLTRLRLRTEVLAEKNMSPDFQKLLEEANRLDLQLENSLWIARLDSQKMSHEQIKLSSMIGSLRVEWPELEINLHQEAIIEADEMALKSIFRNIFQNAWLHGKAKKIDIKHQLVQKKRVITITDDGQGFNGDVHDLGQQFLKSHHDKGNGLGLYLTRDLIQRMDGQIEFRSIEPNGFQVVMTLKEGRLS